MENSWAEEKAWKEVPFKSFLWAVVFFMIKLSPHVLTFTKVSSERGLEDFL